MRYLILFLLVLVGCGTNPVTGENELQLISEQEEVQIGEQNYSYLQQADGGGYVADPSVEAYVQRVGMKLVAVSDRPNLPYEFVVLDNSIPNAWSLPGGKIAINRGLLVELEDEAELAAVLGHEIVHSAARHGAQMMERALLMQAGLSGLGGLLQGNQYEDIVMGTASTGAGLAQLKYSRNAELEADQYGIKYMVAAGYDPEAAVDIQKTFLKLADNRDPNWLEGFLATHPPSRERIAANQATAALYPKGGIRNRQEYEKAIAHLKETAPAFHKLDQGYAALVKGRAPTALRLADEGIAIEPREGHLYNLRGKAVAKLGNPKEALDSFDQAIRCNPYYFDFYLQRGLMEQKLGQYHPAQIDLERSVRLLPSADAHYGLGEIALAQGHQQNAYYHFRIAAQANSPTGEQARQRLASAHQPESLSQALYAKVILRGGHFDLIVSNNTGGSVRDILVEVDFLDRSGRLLERQTYMFQGKLSTGNQARQTFSLPRKTSNATARIIQARF
jgi:predicted Zn-dependent protease